MSERRRRTRRPVWSRRVLPEKRDADQPLARSITPIPELPLYPERDPAAGMRDLRRLRLRDSRRRPETPGTG